MLDLCTKPGIGGRWKDTQDIEIRAAALIHCSLLQSSLAVCLHQSRYDSLVRVHSSVSALRKGEFGWTLKTSLAAAPAFASCPDSIDAV